MNSPEALAALRELASNAHTAYTQKRWAECTAMYAELGERALRARAEQYYNAACCASQGGQLEQAFAHLATGIEHGYRDVRTMVRDTDLEPLRADPRWSDIVDKALAAEAEYLKTINVELYRLYNEDQGARMVENPRDIDWSVVAKQDAERRAQVKQLIEAEALKVGDDYFHAAMIFQHGTKSEDYALANELARKAAELDPSNKSASWLIAATKDRHLQSMGKPQIYGTQYRRNKDGPWTLEPIDETAVTDEERQRLGVPPLAAARERVKVLNKRDGLE